MPEGRHEWKENDRCAYVTYERECETNGSA
jgi:hypothetical protein